MNSFKVSIITINFNNEAGLRKTIESVVGQTFQNIQYIIIDGGSTDGSMDVVKQYIDYMSGTTTIVENFFFM